MTLYNNHHSPDRVERLDYIFGARIDAIETGDGTLYLKVDPTDTTWFGIPYKEACEILLKYKHGLLVEEK